MSDMTSTETQMRQWSHLASDDAIRVRSRQLAREHMEMLSDLVDVRVKSGMTQRDVAEVMGVSQQRVSNIEQYDSDPKLSTLRRYANAVGASWTIEVSTDTAAPVADTPWVDLSMPATRYVAPTKSGGVRVGDWSDFVDYAAETHRTDFSLAA